MDKLPKPGEFNYDLDYFYNMLRMYSPTAKQIADARWHFIGQPRPRYVLDFGSGCGFFRAFAPKGIFVDTYDIMPVPQTGITRDHYDLICFWDVLEHIPVLTDIKPIMDKGDVIAITVPIKPEGLAWEKYKHFKPFEHIHHFTKDSLISLMDKFGFELYKDGTPECPPREMIHSFLFSKK